MRAEDLPRASKLLYVLRPIKRAKFGKYAGKIYHCICGGVANVKKYLPRAENKLSSLANEQEASSSNYTFQKSETRNMAAFLLFDV